MGWGGDGGRDGDGMGSDAMRMGRGMGSPSPGSGREGQTPHTVPILSPGDARRWHSSGPRAPSSSPPRSCSSTTAACSCPPRAGASWPRSSLSACATRPAGGPASVPSSATSTASSPPVGTAGAGMGAGTGAGPPPHHLPPTRRLRAALRAVTRRCDAAGELLGVRARGGGARPGSVRGEAPQVHLTAGQGEALVAVPFSVGYPRPHPRLAASGVAKRWGGVRGAERPPSSAPPGQLWERGAVPLRPAG